MLQINLLCWQSPTLKPSDSPELAQLQVDFHGHFLSIPHSSFGLLRSIGPIESDILNRLFEYEELEGGIPGWSVGSEPEIEEPRQDLGVCLGMSLRRRFDRFAGR